MPRFLFALLGVTALSAPARAEVDFAREVLPILSDHCFNCHGPDAGSRKADLRLDRREDVLRAEAPIVVAGQSGESELIRRLVVESDDSELMPPTRSKKPLKPAQIETLKKWVDEGAKWGNHWAFAAPKRPATPAGAHPIDSIVRANLAKQGVAPAPPADPVTLLRRVTLDLTGLPPTPAEIDDFVQQSAIRNPQSAFEAVVDRLLASPRYGERMVWEWLDAARYADSNGYQGDNERTMWPWRDWAIGAFNRDLPYDQFTTWQIAGDLLLNATHEQKLATGFLRNYMINGEGGRIPEENRVEYVMDMAETVGTVWMGLTFNCCRCHDHKFDALKQSEYYGLYAFFNQTPVDGAGGNPQTAPVLSMETADQRRQLDEAAKPLAAARAELRRWEEEREAARREMRKIAAVAGASAGRAEPPDSIRELLAKPVANRSNFQLETLIKYYVHDEESARRVREVHAALRKWEKLNQSVPRVMVMADRDKPRDTFILSKGLYNKPLEKVPAVTPAALSPYPPGEPLNRLGLANWLTAPDNPLMARVTVNRLWAQFFGVGLVKTAEDFGIQGERPPLQELLDWLAVEFREPTAAGARPWSIKAVVRRIVLSDTYRQSSRMTAADFERDPENRTLARGPRHRLPSWMLRDQALAASGLLTEQFGGPPVRPYQPAGIWEEATFGTKTYKQDAGAALYRRSLYVFWRRIVGPTSFFDVAPRQYCSVKPGRTNTPLHALVTLNDPAYVEAARALAGRAYGEGTDDATRLRAVYRRVLGRTPTERESAVLLDRLKRLRDEYAAKPAAAGELLAVGESPRPAGVPPAEQAAWTGVALVVLNLDEALSKE